MLSKKVNKHSIKIFAFQLGDISSVFIRANELPVYESFTKSFVMNLSLSQTRGSLAGEQQRLLISPGADHRFSRRSHNHRPLICFAGIIFLVHASQKVSRWNK